MELALVFGGVVVSLLVNVLKGWFGTAKLGTMGIVVILSILGAVGYQILSSYGMLEAFTQTFVSAGAFYAFILKNIQSD